MKKKKSIPVQELRIGDTLLEGSKEIKIQNLEPCTQRDAVHVNSNDCYWIHSTVTVR